MAEDRFYFNRKKAEILLVGKTISASRNKTHLYRYIHVDNGSAPQHKHIPPSIEKGSLRHKVFLFYATLLSYHSNSDVWFGQCVKLYKRANWMFTGEILNLDVSDVVAELKKIGAIYPNSSGRYWWSSGQTLFGDFRGNPLNIFKGIKSIDALMKMKCGKRNRFPGLGPKIASLLALFYEELGLLPHIKGAFPVDVHIQNQCIGTKIVTFDIENFDVNTTTLAEFLRKKIAALCYMHQVSPLELSHALWFLGSKLCVRCNKEKRVAEKYCPLFGHCSGRFPTKMYREYGRWVKQPLPELPLFRAGQ